MMISVNQTSIYLGGLNSENEAAKYYDKIAILFQGVLAKTNFDYTAMEVNGVFATFLTDQTSSGTD